MTATQADAPHPTGSISTHNERFFFHPRSTNPELWRTTVPLVVRERCKRHKGLIATWTAIHWLIVLHAASGRTHFGMREIAEEAGVGRNELAGPAGHIQRLVDLGLISIVGYKQFRGLREPRPVYHVDLAELERLSLDLVPELLRERQIDRPPPPTPDPRQLRLAIPRDDSASEHPLPLSSRTWPYEVTGDVLVPAGLHGNSQFRRGNGTEGGVHPSLAARSEPLTHGNGTAIAQATTVTNHYSPVVGTEAHQNGVDRHSQVPAVLEPVPGSPESGIEVARQRDMDGENERSKDRARQLITPDLLRDLVALTTAAVIAALQPRLQQTPAEVPPVLTQTPSAPGAAGPLNASVLALWQGNGPEPRQRDIQQLALLAGEYDEPTRGYGAYWLGRAILMADLCLGGEQPVTIAYVRRMLRRWCEEGSWGSDREMADSPSRGVSEPTPRSRPSREPLCDTERHPAVSAYIDALNETPNDVQAAQIAKTVTDLATWRQVLTDWQLNGWGERSVGKMLDRYQKSSTPAVAGSESPPSVAALHTYPNLTPEQRDRWIRKFHAAATTAEKRAVLSRLEQEHPR